MYKGVSLYRASIDVELYTQSDCNALSWLARNPFVLAGVGCSTQRHKGGGAAQPGRGTAAEWSTPHPRAREVVE
jgi:hypothetical protein